MLLLLLVFVHNVSFGSVRLLANSPHWTQFIFAFYFWQICFMTVFCVAFFFSLSLSSWEKDPLTEAIIIGNEPFLAFLFNAIVVVFLVVIFFSPSFKSSSSGGFAFHSMCVWVFLSLDYRANFLSCRQFASRILHFHLFHSHYFIFFMIYFVCVFGCVCEPNVSPEKNGNEKERKKK